MRQFAGAGLLVCNARRAGGWYMIRTVLLGLIGLTYGRFSD